MLTTEPVKTSELVEENTKQAEDAAGPVVKDELETKDDETKSEGHKGSEAT